MDCNHITKVLDWGFTEKHDFKVVKWGCVLCDATSDTPFKDEDVVEIDHTNCDEDCFGCKARGLQLSTGDAGKEIGKKSLESRLKFYKDARNQGIQPAGTHPVQVEAAHKASETLGKAYDAGTMGVRADKVTKSVDSNVAQKKDVIFTMSDKLRYNLLKPRPQDRSNIACSRNS
jgi:hypothetical protein